MEFRQSDNDGGGALRWWGIMMGSVTAQMDDDLYTDQ